jgi:hypothetical protein
MLGFVSKYCINLLAGVYCCAACAESFAYQ